MVVVQSHVAHAVHRLRPFPAAVVDGHVADHVVHDQRRHVLRPVPGARHQSDTELGLVPPTVPRKGLEFRARIGGRNFRFLFPLFFFFPPPVAREQVKQVEEFMSYRRLPLDMRKRITEYFEHRYQGRFFDEKWILNEMSDQLREVSGVKWGGGGEINGVSDVLTRWLLNSGSPKLHVPEAGDEPAALGERRQQHSRGADKLPRVRNVSAW